VIITRNGEPNSLVTGARGELTSAMARVASGIPPNGHDQRTSSASTIPAGNTALRMGRLDGVAMPAKAKNIENRITENGQPTAVRSNIHKVAGADHESPMIIDVTNRVFGDGSSMRRNQMPSPMIANGHHPQGGMAAAMRRPARTDRAKRLTAGDATPWSRPGVGQVRSSIGRP